MKDIDWHAPQIKKISLNNSGNYKDINYNVYTFATLLMNKSSPVYVPTTYTVTHVYYLSGE